VNNSFSRLERLFSEARRGHKSTAVHCQMLNQQDGPKLNPPQLGDTLTDLSTNAKPTGNKGRMRATVLFADIVGSTELLVGMGDVSWARVLKRYYALARMHVSFFEGKILGTAGDGFLACFESPPLAVRCASAIRSSTNALGLKIRIGLHTGDCLKVGTQLMGLTLHIGARIAAAAGINEVLVSDSVRAQLDGSELKLVERGSYYLKGLPGEWRLFLT
jgi:class 3 adenylate cyclase